MKSKRPTISDVAAAAGVGAATVDRVLNGRARVKPETARRILQAAEAINYRAANILRERVKEVEQQQKLGFLLLKQSCLFYQGLGRELKHASVQAGHQPVLTYMEDLRPDVLAAALDALAGKVDAVALPVADHPQIRQVVRDRNADANTRRGALDSLLTSRDAELPKLLQELLNDAALRGPAIRGLARFEAPGTAEAILKIYL